MTFVVLIAGVSGSGKSALAAELAGAWRGRCAPLCVDNYYRDLAHVPFEKRALTNFDDPAAIDHEMAAHHLRALADGNGIDTPVYSFATHTRTGEVMHVEPAPVVVAEGILALHWPELRSIAELRVFVECPLELCLQRRINRDTRERERTEADVRRQFAEQVEPMARRYVLPSARHADITVRGDGDLGEALWAVMAEAALLPGGPALSAEEAP
jgi:uridine kinase